MWKLHNKSMVIFSGVIWLCIGLMLLSIGTNLFIQGITAIDESNIAVASYPLMKITSDYVGKAPIAAALLFALSTCLGYFKGRYVLSRSAKRSISRIATLPSPSPIYQLYSPVYYLLLALMIGLGMSFKLLGIGGEIRAIIDVAVGSALISGSLEYFRTAYSYKTQVQG